MNITKFNKAKLKWLLKQGPFRKNPVRTLFRVASWELLRWRNQPIDFVFDGSFRTALHPNEGASRLTYYFSNSEPELFKFYASFVKLGMTVLDVGANIGLHALYFSKRVGPKGKIYAFEPDESIFARLRWHVESNKIENIECVNAALGSVPGFVEVVRNTDDTSRTFVRDLTANVSPGTCVAVQTLDAFVIDRQIQKIDFLKLDVEGFENEILTGGMALLAQQAIHVIQIELDSKSLARAGSGEKNIIKTLQEQGYLLAKWNFEISCFQSCTQTDYNSFFVSPRVMSSNGRRVD